MDNPNDFIHIDEVFRKLKDREEPEGTGSWMRMKELLDKEMPVGSPVSRFSTLRRYIIPVVATLLIGGGGAYYGISRNDNKDLLHSGNTAIVSVNADAKHPASSGTGTSGYEPGNGKDHNHSGKYAIPGNQDRNAKEKVAVSGNTGSKAMDQQHISDRYADNNNTGSHPATNDATKKIAKNNLSDKGNNAVIAASGETHHSKVNGIDGHKTPTGKSTAALTNGKAPNTVPPAAKPFEKQNVLETIYPVSNGTKKAGLNNNNGIVSNAGNVSPDMKVVAANYEETKIVKDENGSLFREIRDTIRKIDMVQRTETKDERGNNTMRTVIDTLAITRVERIRYTPLAPLEIAALRKANIIPKAEAVVPMARIKTITVAKNEMVNMVPLSDYKVASRKVDPSKFNKLVQNTSLGISNYFDGTNKFYAAVLLGGNGFVGNPTAFGMQFGIAGLYQLTERLTLSGELKFANHYFSNYSINDQSVTYDNVNGTQLSTMEWLFSGTQNTTTSAYKVNSFSALEFPVTLSYSLGRVSVFGGVNMSYAFPVKWNKSNNISTSAVSSTENQNQNPFLNSGFKLNEQKDFGSRFGMGYVAGLSYDISRKLSFDARVTQNVWTDYNGNADAVNKLFKMPTFQFSIGYFFGRKERVMYILDK